MKNDNKKWNDDWKENPVSDNILQFVSSLIFALFINLLSSFDFDMFYILSFSAAAFGGFLIFYCVKEKEAADSEYQLRVESAVFSGEKIERISKQIAIKKDVYKEFNGSIKFKLRLASICLVSSVVFLIIARNAAVKEAGLQYEKVIQKIESIEKK